VLALMKEAAGRPARVLKNPAPNPLVMQFGESAIELELRFWIADAQNGVHNVMSEVLLEIWRLFRDHGIRIPYPKRDVVVHPAETAEAEEAVPARSRAGAFAGRR
jgi:small-conductance mechanosensitive channel